MNLSTTMIEQMITEYITNNITSESDISITQIKNDLSRIIKQKPAIEVKYEKIRKLNEKSGKTEVVSEPIKSITIAFVEEGSYTNNMPNIKKLEIFI